MDSYLDLRPRTLRNCALLISTTFLSPVAWADEDEASNRSSIVSRPLVIEAPDGSSTQATDVNNRGAAVGASITQDGAVVAFTWTRHRGFRSLESSGEVELPFSIAFAISECGVIVGQANLPGELSSHAVRWVNFEIEDLGTLGGGFSAASDINERGHIVGFSSTSIDATHAFLWTKEEGMIDLGTLGGDLSVADAINNHGEVVGSSTLASGEEHAYIWSRRTGMVDLGAQGGESSRAFAINDRGEVAVSTSSDLGNVARGFVWTRRHGFVELKDRVDFGFPMSINHGGIVAGTTRNENGNRLAALWPKPRKLVRIDPQIGETDSDAVSVSDSWAAGTALFDGGETQRGVVWRLRIGEPDRHHERKLARLCRQ